MRCTRRRAQGTGLASPARIATLLRHFGGRFFRVADHVKAVDENCTQLYGVVAKAAIVPIEIGCAKYVATDLSDDYQQALASILHTPILSVNVALHNWRFLGQIGNFGGALVLLEAPDRCLHYDRLRFFRQCPVSSGQAYRADLFMCRF